MKRRIAAWYIYHTTVCRRGHQRERKIMEKRDISMRADAEGQLREPRSRIVGPSAHIYGCPRLLFCCDACARGPRRQLYTISCETQCARKVIEQVSKVIML